MSLEEPDPILAEIRAHREAHAAKFNYDVDALCDDLERREKDSKREFVSYPPKRVQPVGSARGKVPSGE